MPHFIIECSEDVLKKQSPYTVMEAVHKVARTSGLFTVNDIKVRIKTYEHYLVAGELNSFIHVFCYIVEGRTDPQKKELSKKVVSLLRNLFADVTVVSMNIQEFEKSNYCKMSLI